MSTLRKQLDELRWEYSHKITDLLQEFVDRTGYVPITIKVKAVEATTPSDTEQKYIIDTIDLGLGL